MAEHGGYRRPAHPAAVSGPGAMSQRTDGGPQAIQTLPNAKYGEASAFQAAEQAAPMSSGGMPGGAPGGMAPLPDTSGITPFGAPTQNPGEDIMSGLPGGPGAGPTTGPTPSISPEQADRLRSYLPVLVLLASQPDADPATRQFVRQMRGELG